MYIDKDFVKPDTVERREYQVHIADSAAEENTLVVLPTGLGKTIIALLIIAEKLKEKKGKILFLAPTKPLVNQHADFLKKFLTVEDEDVVVFTGEVSPEDRGKIWSEAKIVVSTPQVIKNDLLTSRVTLENVCFLIFDEAHHAVGDYAYVFVSEMYRRHGSDDRLVLGITASPGGDVSKIMEVCENLDINNIEIRTKHDRDVKPYVHDLKIRWKEIDLPDDFGYSVDVLKQSLSKRLKFLKELGFLDSSSVTRVNKKHLLEVQKRIQHEIKQQVKPSKKLFKAASVQSEAMKIQYAIDLLQTQGVHALRNYFNRISREANSKGGSKASRSIMKDDMVLEAVAYAKSLDVEHPKVDEIAKIVERQLESKPESKIIVFTHYRDTSSFISGKLSEVSRAKPSRFIGQSGRGKDKGLTQKEQAEIINKFKQDEYNVLIATSVAEEGLDIPSTDLVVFYEPIPSEIRFIQRRGRTARKMPGEVIILITKGTSDEGYYWSAKRKEKQMRKQLELLRSKLDKKFESAKELSFSKKEKDNQSDQRTLKEYSNNKSDIKILVDHREYRSNVVKNLSLKNVTVEPCQLDVGDYVLSSRVGVERKNVDDFLSSLLDGKLFEQIRSLNAAYSRPVLIIEGKNLYEKRNINHNAIFGSLASISVDFGVSIMNTRDPLETADMLRVIAKREQKKHKKSVAIRGEKYSMSLKERQQFLIEGLPNVSAVLAERLLNHFGNVRAIVNASVDDLMEVKGVGRQIASDIVHTLNAEFEES
ncbi:MAG: DEAD/DEAH box helicase [Candidatus Thermoplasmatota archaeon]